jgi:hypothetical protein
MPSSGLRFDQIDLRAWPKEYVQAAGSSARMMAEIRRIEAGEPKHYALGRQVDGQHGHAVIEWDGYLTTVRTNEVLNVDQVGDLFVAFYETGELPASVTCRLLAI